MILKPSTPSTYKDKGNLFWLEYFTQVGFQNTVWSALVFCISFKFLTIFWDMMISVTLEYVLLCSSLIISLLLSLFSLLLFYFFLFYISTYLFFYFATSKLTPAIISRVICFLLLMLKDTANHSRWVNSI